MITEQKEKARTQIAFVCTDDLVPHFSTFGKNYSRRFEGTDLFVDAGYKIHRRNERIILSQKRNHRKNIWNR